jgi:hypothetical protein
MLSREIDKKGCIQYVKNAASLRLQPVVHIVTTEIYADTLEQCTDECECDSNITSHVPVLSNWWKTGRSTKDVLFLRSHLQSSNGKLKDLLSIYIYVEQS